MIFTTSPILAWLFSSWALNFFVYLTRFPYRECFLYVSTLTVIVLSILSLTTLPVRTLRLLRSVTYRTSFLNRYLFQVLFHAKPSLHERYSYECHECEVGYLIVRLLIENGG